MFIDRLSLSPTVLYTCLDLKSRRFAAANDHDDKSSVSGDDLHLVLLGSYSDESTLTATNAFVMKEKMSIDLPKNSISYHYSLHPNDTIIGYMIVKDSMEGGMSPDTFRCVDHLTDFFDLHFMQPCVVVCNISNILETCSSPMQSASSSSNFMSAFSSIVNDFSLLSPSTTDKSSKENNSSKNVTGPIIPKFIFKPIEIIGSLDSKQSIVMTNLNLLKFCIDHTMSLDSPMNLVVLKDQCKFYCNALRNLLSDAKTEKSDLDAEKLKYISESIEKIYKSIDENLELTNIKSEGCSLSEYMATLIQKVSILDSNP